MNLLMVEHYVRMRHAELTEEAHQERAVREARSTIRASKGSGLEPAGLWSSNVQRTPVEARS